MPWQISGVNSLEWHMSQGCRGSVESVELLTAFWCLLRMIIAPFSFWRRPCSYLGSSGVENRAKALKSSLRIFWVSLLTKVWGSTQDFSTHVFARARLERFCPDRILPDLAICTNFWDVSFLPGVAASWKPSCRSGSSTISAWMATTWWVTLSWLMGCAMKVKYKSCNNPTCFQNVLPHGCYTLKL